MEPNATAQRNSLADLAEDHDRRLRRLCKRLKISESLNFAERYQAAAFMLIHQQPEFGTPKKIGRPKKRGLSYDELRAHFVEVFDQFLPGWGTNVAIQMGRKLEPELFRATDRTIKSSISAGRAKLGLSRRKIRKKSKQTLS